MLGENRVKLAVVPLLVPLRKVVDVLRGLPLPRPLQRLTERGLARLAERIPQLGELLDGKRRVAPRSVPPASAPLLELIAQLASLDYRVRLRAVQALVHHREPAASEALAGALRDLSVEVAIAAVSSLQIVSGVKARGTLHAVLENEHDYYHPLVRAAAVHGLGSLLSEAQCAPIIKALRDREAEVSIAAISALGASAPRRAGELLLQVIENQDGFFLPITRLAAARGLERLSSLPKGSLLRVSDAESDPQLREILARAIDRHGLAG